jgi:hypothetical protein
VAQLAFRPIKSMRRGIDARGDASAFLLISESDLLSFLASRECDKERNWR